MRHVIVATQRIRQSVNGTHTCITEGYSRIIACYEHIAEALETIFFAVECYFVEYIYDNLYRCLAV